ncbi:MAG: NADH-quinone oxidoreductase subunit NuoK [Bacteroidetes bacterium]|jgi:NADH:ubiquinone oxidoreductase subunit K|nr:NADH-quinone oxidoreductase subunit NuoK [Bacteroidota bacterium]
MNLFTLACLLFSAGLFLAITRRQAVAMLLGIELILNGAALNFVHFNERYPQRLDGQMMALAIIVVAAAEAAVGLALILNLYRRFRSADVYERKDLQG